MQTTVQVQGKSDLDALQRAEAVKTILALDTKELKNLASLAASPKARGWLSEPKFTTLKTML